jgi:flavin reductase
MAVSPDIFKLGMRQLGSAVTIITTEHNGQLGGLTATSVMSLTTNPPRLLASVNKSGYTYDLLRQSKTLCVNVLSTGQVDIAKRFAGLTELDESDRFEGLNWSTLSTGAPMIEGALVSFDCDISEVIEATSHGVFISDIQSVHISENPIAPLIYMDGQFTTLGKQLSA